MLPNNNHQMNKLIVANTNISIETMSPKHLLGQCISMATQFLRELVKHYIQLVQLQENYPNEKSDLTAYMNFLLEPNRLDSVIQQITKTNNKSQRALIRNWLHELKYFRNSWAHSEVIDFRLAMRSFDTLSLTYQAFGGDKNSELYKKIQHFRKTLIICHAKSCLI